MERKSFFSLNQEERIATLLKTPQKSPFKYGRQRGTSSSKKDEQAKVIQLQSLKNEVNLLRTPVKRMDSLDSCNMHTPPKRRRGRSLQMTDERTPLTTGMEKSPLKQQLETPNQKRNIQTESKKETKGSDCQKMLEALNVTMINRPVCRETEVEKILNFLQVYIKDGQCGSLYITGPPGTGKTACVMHCLQNHKIKKSGAKVHVVNCMALKTGNAIFKQIAKEFEVNVGRKTSLALSEALKKYFRKSGPMIILVMDELDQLESRHQEVLYQIFEWATLPGSRLLLIGIANALEPLEHSLPQLQVWKKHKPILLQFQPYKREQIKAIIEDRLQVCKEDSDLVLRPEVIEYCSRNAASHNGDVRKALAMLSQAVVLVMNGNDTKNDTSNKQIELTSIKTNADPPATERLQVRLHHVQKVVTSVSSSISSLNNTASQLPLQQKIVVCCLILLLKKSKTREITFGKLQDTYLQLCRKQMMSAIDGGDLLSLCSQLEDLGIVTMKKKKKETHLTKLSLQIDEMDLEPLLKEEKLIMNIFNDKTLNIC